MARFKAGTYKKAHTWYYGQTSVCDVCPVGTAASAGAEYCHICEAGKYESGHKCEKCPTGYTSDNGAIGSNQCYMAVSEGKYKNDALLPSQASCPENTWSLGATKAYYGTVTTCNPCPDGKTSPVGSDRCS